MYYITTQLRALLKNVPRCMFSLPLFTVYLTLLPFYLKPDQFKVNKWPKWATECLRSDWALVMLNHVFRKIYPYDPTSKLQEKEIGSDLTLMQRRIKTPKTEFEVFFNSQFLSLWKIKILNIISFSAPEPSRFNRKSCNLIGSWSGRNFLIRTATADGIRRVDLFSWTNQR